MVDDVNLESLSEAEQARMPCLTEAAVKAHVTAIMKALKVEKRAKVLMALEKLGIEIKSLAK
jgi:DNA-binding NarL/FixJ family response regulator